MQTAKIIILNFIVHPLSVSTMFIVTHTTQFTQTTRGVHARYYIDYATIDVSVQPQATIVTGQLKCARYFCHRHEWDECITLQHCGNNFPHSWCYKPIHSGGFLPCYSIDTVQGYSVPPATKNRETIINKIRTQGFKFATTAGCSSHEVARKTLREGNK